VRSIRAQPTCESAAPLRVASARRVDHSVILSEAKDPGAPVTDWAILQAMMKARRAKAPILPRGAVLQLSRWRG
jgi:hypothetical protein